MTVHGAEELAKGLENNGALQALDLRSCSIGTDGARRIMEAVRTAGGLNFLNLALNGIGYLPRSIPASEGGSMTSHLSAKPPRATPTSNRRSPTADRLKRREGVASSARSSSKASSQGQRNCRDGVGCDADTELVVALDITKHLSVELNKDLTVLVVHPGGQADRLAGKDGSLVPPFPLAMGCRLVRVGGLPVISKDAMKGVIDEMIADGLADDPVPISFKNKITRTSAFALDNGEHSTVEVTRPPKRITVATCDFFKQHFYRCPYLERLNASFNAGVRSVLIYQKRSYEAGAMLNVDWRGRGQYWEAELLDVDVNKPVQSFDVRYTIDGVVERNVLPTRVQGYVKERKDRNKAR